MTDRRRRHAGSLSRRESRSLSHRNSLQHASGVPGENVEKRRPIGLIRCIGNRTIRIQHGNHGSANRNRPRGRKPGRICASEIGGLAVCLWVHTLRRSNRLSHESGIAQFNVEPCGDRRKIKADNSPIAQSVTFDQKNRRAAGFPTGPKRQTLENLAKRRRCVQSAHSIWQTRRLRHALFLITQRIGQPAYLEANGVGIPSRCLDIVQRRFDVVACLVKLPARRFEIVLQTCDFPLTLVDSTLMLIDASLGVLRRFVEATVKIVADFSKLKLSFATRLGRSVLGGVGRDACARVVCGANQLVLTRAKV